MLCCIVMLCVFYTKVELYFEIRKFFCVIFTQ